MNGKFKPFTIDKIVLVARKARGTYAVGLLSGRWLGLYRLVPDATDETGETAFVHVFPEVADGVRLGLPDRADAIRFVSALAADPDGQFGPPDEWFVPPEARGEPELYRCPDCRRVGCGRECLEYDA